MTGLVHTPRVAGIASERWPASVRNHGRLQIGIPAGIKSEYPAGLRRNPHRSNEWPIHLVTWDKVLFQGTSNIMCWLSDWIRLIHPMHWFQSLLRSSRRLKPQISHGFLAPFEGFPDASPGVLQVWENVGIQVIMGLSTGIPMARRLPPPIMGPTGIPMHPSGWDSLDAYIPLATDKVPVDPEN